MREYLRSAVEISQIAIDAGKLVCMDIVEFAGKKLDQIDTRFSNAINGENDE